MRFNSIAALLIAVAGQNVLADVDKMDRLMEIKTAQWEKAQAEGFFAGSRLYKKLASRRPCINGVSGRSGESQYAWSMKISVRSRLTLTQVPMQQRRYARLPEPRGSWID